MGGMGRVPAVESLLVITNTGAASTDDDTVRRAIDVLATGADVQVCRTTLPGELDGVLHRRGGRTIVVAGGDGSLHTVVAALHRRDELADALIALLPLGTTNAFARGAGIPLDPAAAAQAVLTGVERRLDLLTDCHGDVVVDTVRLSAKRHRTPRVYHARRASGGGRGSALRVRVEADGEVLADFDRPVSAVGLGRVDGGGAAPPTGPAIASGARAARTAQAGGAPSTFRGRDRAGAAQVMVSFAGPPLADLWHGGRPDRQLTRQAHRVKVIGQRFWLNADGEVSGPERRRTWQVASARLRMILPAGAPGTRVLDREGSPVS